jgi:hypothetical protein
MKMHVGLVAMLPERLSTVSPSEENMKKYLAAIVI